MFPANDNIMFDSCSNFTIFCYSFEDNWKRPNNSLYRGVAKTFKIAAKPNNILIFIKSQLSFLAFIELDRLGIKSKKIQIWTKIEILFLKLKVTKIESIRGRRVSNFLKMGCIAKKCIISGFQNHLQNVFSIPYFLN